MIEKNAKKNNTNRRRADGGNLALLAAQKELGDILIFDIPKAEGMVKGKALDLMQLRPHDGFDSDIRGTSNWDETRNTDVFIITAGIPENQV